MDAKYLEAIKARDGETMPDTAAPVFRDRHALIAEVERLRSCKCVNKCKLVCMLEEYDKVVAERDTLKKALETEKENYCELCKNIAAAHGVDTFCSHCPKWRGIQQEQGDTLPEDRPAPENASKVVKNLWALYDKYEDAEHAVCGEAATLLSAAPEAPHGLQTTWDTPRTCKHCHEHLAEDWSYCPECGRPTGENKPLTLDELRRMDGEPVWCDWVGGWAIVYIDGASELTFVYWDGSSNTLSELRSCNINLLAYDRKPEQEDAP